ncbi:MAG: hypothetical protein FJX75_02195 [Armatimonadetes bacterium]|nr:hypothetical protein [Armatimonadota bacterium]
MSAARETTRYVLLVGALVALGFMAGGCGCGKRGGKSGGIAQLRQTRLRFAADERKATCYIVAEVENAGKLPVRQAKVTATLVSKSGRSRGLNYAFLRDMAPGEKRTLYMTVTTHGSFHRVELTFHGPKERS